MYIDYNLKLRKMRGFKRRGIEKRTFFRFTNYLPLWERKKSFCIFFKNSTWLELRFIKFVFFKFRRCFVRKKYFLTLNIKPNFSFSKKSKNARMGKGNGSFKRPVKLIKVAKPFIMSTKFSKNRFKNILSILRGKNPHIFL